MHSFADENIAQPASRVAAADFSTSLYFSIFKTGLPNLGFRGASSEASAI